jgi:oligopeptide transport system substrate-binding protein
MRSLLAPIVGRAFRPPVVSAIAALLLLAGCKPRETAVETGAREQRLILGNAAEPAELDPQTTTAFTDGNILMALLEGLTAIDEVTLQTVPSSAANWETSTDGLTWTFHLRPNLRWSNGEPLVAEDFVASWRRLVTPAIAADNAYLIYPVKNAEAINGGKIKDVTQLGVVAPDEHTVVVTLERPTPYFPQLVANPATFAINPRVLTKFGGLDRRGSGWTRPENYVGSGPFVLKEWSPNQHIVVAKNPNYWDAANVALREIVFVPTDNPDVDERNFRAGQVHATFTLPLTKVAGWRERDPGKLRIDPLLQSVFLRFNTTRSPLGDVRVRRALSLAIDREALTRSVLQGTRPPARSLTPPNIAGYTARAQVATDFAAARQLLADAGHAGGAGLPAFELQCKSDEIQPRLAEAIQAIWQRELGVRVTIAPAEQKIWLQNQQTMNYTIVFGSWVADVADASNFLGMFTTNGGYNWTGWKDPEYDRLLNEAGITLKADQRLEVLQRAEARLLEEAPVAPVFFGAQTYLLDPSVKGWPPSALGFRRYQLVRLEK